MGPNEFDNVRESWQMHIIHVPFGIFFASMILLKFSNVASMASLIFAPVPGVTKGKRGVLGTVKVQKRAKIVNRKLISRKIANTH